MKFGRVSATPYSNHSLLCILLLYVFFSTNRNSQSITYSFQQLFCAACSAFVTISGAQPEVFQEREGFLKAGHFDKNLICSSQKRQGKVLENYFLVTIKIAF